MPQPPITPAEWAESLAWARAMLAQAPRPLFGPGAPDAFHVEPLPPDVPPGHARPAKDADEIEDNSWENHKLVPG